MKNGANTIRPRKFRKKTTIMGSSSCATWRMLAFMMAKLIVEMIIKRMLRKRLDRSWVGRSMS